MSEHHQLNSGKQISCIYVASVCQMGIWIHPATQREQPAAYAYAVPWPTYHQASSSASRDSPLAKTPYGLVGNATL